MACPFLPALLGASRPLGQPMAQQAHTHLTAPLLRVPAAQTFPRRLHLLRQRARPGVRRQAPFHQFRGRSALPAAQNLLAQRLLVVGVDTHALAPRLTLT